MTDPYYNSSGFDKCLTKTDVSSFVDSSEADLSNIAASGRLDLGDLGSISANAGFGAGGSDSGGSTASVDLGANVGTSTTAGSGTGQGIASQAAGTIDSSSLSVSDYYGFY